MDEISAPIRFPFAAPPADGAALQIAPGVLWMRLPLPMALDHVNVYALDEGDSWTLIDTGLDSKRSRQSWAGLLAGPLVSKPVGRVVLTHHHPDHVGLAGWFLAQGAELWAPRTAWLMARMLVLDRQDTASPEQIGFWRAAGMPAALLEARSAERPFNFADCVALLPLGYRRLQQGMLIEMAGRWWDVHMGNGHAPEHATFWSRDDDLVIGGDQLLPGISANLGTYATEPEADPVGEWLEACQRFMPLARPDHLVLPGHKLPYRGLPFRLAQMVENHHSALQRLLAHLQTPSVAVDCFLPLFKRPIGGSEYGLALVESVAHLNHLHQGGLVQRTRRADGAWLWQQS